MPEQKTTIKLPLLRLPKAGVFLYKKERHYIGVILMKTKIEKDLGMCDQKEREFMEELYRKYERLMYATVRRYISDSMEQEEIVQESLKKLIEKRRVLCNLDCAAQAGYIVVAIRNTSFSYLRKRNRERSKIISLETLNEEGMRHIILAEEELFMRKI